MLKMLSVSYFNPLAFEVPREWSENSPRQKWIELKNVINNWIIRIEWKTLTLRNLNNNSYKKYWKKLSPIQTTAMKTSVSFLMIQLGIMRRCSRRMTKNKEGMLCWVVLVWKAKAVRPVAESILKMLIKIVHLLNLLMKMMTLSTIICTVIMKMEVNSKFSANRKGIRQFKHRKYKFFRTIHSQNKLHVRHNSENYKTTINTVYPRTVWDRWNKNTPTLSSLNPRIQ